MPAKKTGFQDKLAQKMGGAQARDILFGISRDLAQIIEVDLDKLEPNPDQPRREFHPEALRELAASIEAHGLIQPIAIQRNPEAEGRFYIVAGERRFRAHRILGRDTIPAILTTGNREELALIENVQREDLNPVEFAESLARLAERRGYTQEVLSRVIGKKPSTVSEILLINRLPEEIRTEYRTSDVLPTSRSVLVEIARIDDPARQLALWKQVREGKLTVKAARAAKQGKSTEPPKTPEEKTLLAGLTFVSRLRALTFDLDAEADHEVYARLREIQRQINDLLPDADRTEQ